jgi:hypothetical protein
MLRCQCAMMLFAFISLPCYHSATTRVDFERSHQIPPRPSGSCFEEVTSHEVARRDALGPLLISGFEVPSLPGAGKACQAPPGGQRPAKVWPEPRANRIGPTNPAMGPVAVDNSCGASVSLFFRRKACHWPCLSASAPKAAVRAGGRSGPRGVRRRTNASRIAEAKAAASNSCCRASSYAAVAVAVSLAVPGDSR